MQLPKKFINSVPSMESADLLIVMGTSLTVHPFASLAWMVADSCPRVLVNLERVGDFGSRPDDLILLGQCDDYVRKLCKELGWLEDLERLWEETKESVVTDSLDATKEEKAKVEESASKENAKKPATVIKTDDTLEEINKGLSHLAIDSVKEVKEEEKPKTDEAPSAGDLPTPSKEVAPTVHETKSSPAEVRSAKDSDTASSTLKDESPTERKQ